MTFEWLVLMATLFSITTEYKSFNSKNILMILFEDIVFDFLPKIPDPNNSSIEIKPIEQPRVFVPSIISTPLLSPDEIPPIKGSNLFRWFLFGLLVLGTVCATIYMANKDSSRNEEN
ncbi:hypothetical protein [Sediminibacterium sp. C3]|uniref:hypothetical protein n=1 Tax=Sediminibacterium sp. C3 TaxID=1267211 RepID=UPI00047E950E|nr:hypothetical protein [Sediminibacterium sp. C3]